MNKPNLNSNHLWEVFIWINPAGKDYVNIIRCDIAQMITQLKEKYGINWYCFLVHNKQSGVPKEAKHDGLYFHIRLELNTEISREKLNNILPLCCEKEITSQKELNSIAGVITSLLKNNDIAEAWKIIGEASEGIINLLNIFENDRLIPSPQILQFVHFYHNMLIIKQGSCLQRPI